MSTRQSVLLTGATGLLGRYLLRDLLLSGQGVAVLVRDGAGQSAQERVAELLSFWSEQLGRRLPAPVVVTGDLRQRSAGLDRTARHWLARSCNAVVHAAANLSFRSTAHGEPWTTNVEGTQHLLRLAGELGLVHWHFISTAFVCGRRRGVIHEDELDLGQECHNAYERSKLTAEQAVRAFPGVCATIFRPAVIVGDSRTGYTSNYAGLYQFLALGARLADACPPSSRQRGQERRRLPLRLPLSGDERTNAVPVDWVARAIVELLAQPGCHGRTFHLVSRTPVAARLVHEVAAAELGLDGVELAGADGVTRPNRIEEMFLEGLEEYWPYLGGGAAFDDRNTAAALPHLPPPAVDRDLLRRLIRFAVKDRWGRGPSAPQAEGPKPHESRCTRYFEEIFPRQAQRSRLARDVGLDVLVGFDITGPGGGQWSCLWERGEFRGVMRGIADEAAVVYRTDVATFAAVIDRRETPQQAFFAQRVTVDGDLEVALKLVVIFERFLRENPALDAAEALDATLA